MTVIADVETEADMAHELNAILGKVETLQPRAREHGIPAVPLRHGFALIPLTPEIQQALVGRRRSEQPTKSVGQDELHEVFKRWSTEGPIVHATNDVFSGLPGVQAAWVWQDGRLVFGQEGNAYSGPISMALLRLGVTGGRFGWDEFDQVGLGRYRETEQWLAADKA
jgi:hypothetical protein